MSVKVTGLTMKDYGASKGGFAIRAFFDCQTEELGFKGCALARKPDGGWTVWAPKLEGAAGRVRGEQIAVYWKRGSMIEAAILDAALAAYGALGGDVEAEDGPGALGAALAEELA